MEFERDDLNFNQLRLFLAVAEHGGMTSAAEAIFVSQPAISKAVRDLERDLGQPLLERRGRGVVLTEAGALLAGYARQIFDLAAESRHALDELRGLERGSLAIGASTTIGVYLLPRLMGRFHAHHPAVRLTLDIANTEEVIERLLAGSLDLALVEGPVDRDGLRVVPYRHDRLVLVAAPNHRLARSAPVTADDLAKAPFLEREHGSGTRTVVEAVLARYGIAPNVAMELGDTEAIKQAVMAGLGVSIMSELAVEREVAAGLLAEVPIAGIAISRNLLLVERSRSRSSAAARAFLALLRG